MCFAQQGFSIFVKSCGLKKILVIRFSSIGDIVLTTPVIRALKTQLKDCRVDFLTKESFRPVIEANPYLDNIFTIQKEINEIISLLKAVNYDHIVDLHKNFRSLGVRIKLRKPASSFPKVNFQKFLLVNLKINLLPGVHIVDRYFKAVKSLGVKNDGKGLDYFIPSGAEVGMQDLPLDFRDGYVAFVIGGKHNTKQLPAEQAVLLCNKTGLPVIMLGGPEDEDLGEVIAKNLAVPVLNACGKYTINQSASLVKNSRAVLTNDTGLMHVAAAFRKKIVSLWGNTVPDFGMYPYLPINPENNAIFGVSGLSCRPCSKLGYEVCPRGHFKCMRDQDINAISENLLQFWDEAGH